MLIGVLNKPVLLWTIATRSQPSFKKRLIESSKIKSNRILRIFYKFNPQLRYKFPRNAHQFQAFKSRHGFLFADRIKYMLIYVLLVLITFSINCNKVCGVNLQTQPYTQISHVIQKFRTKKTRSHGCQKNIHCMLTDVYS